VNLSMNISLKTIYLSFVSKSQIWNKYMKMW
jgi:hypothetical protein